MPICRACAQPKPISEFYLNNGRPMKKCKACWRAQVTLRRRTNPAVQAYDRERAKQPHRKAHARQVTIRWREENPEAYRAHNALNNALRDGKITRPESCETDGCDRADLHAHHHDYSKPLEVTWKCPLHHHRDHADERTTA